MSYDEWRFTFGAKTKAEIDAIPKSDLKEGYSVWNSDLKKPEYVNSYKERNPCTNGMDVIVMVANTGGFANDYGASIKSMLSTLPAYLATVGSAGNRLGFVLYDFQFNSAYAPYNRVPDYLTATGYTSLPAAQKYLSSAVTNTYLGTSLSPYTVGNQVRATALVSLNFANGAAFNAAVASWGTTAFPYGVQIDGNQYPAALSGGRFAVGAPVGEAIYRVVAAGLGGTFASTQSNYLIIFNEGTAADGSGSEWALNYAASILFCQARDINVISYEYTPATRPNSNLAPGPISGS